MRILQVVPTFAPSFGGTYSVVDSISKELSKRHEVTVYTTCALNKNRDFRDSPCENQYEKLHVIYFPRVFKRSGLNISLSMMKHLPQAVGKYDIIHLHSWRNFQDIIVHHYAQKYSVPYILQVHGSLPIIGSRTLQGLKRVYNRTYGSQLLNDASKVIAFNKMEVEHYRSLSVPNEKIVLIPNGIDLSKYIVFPIPGTFKKKYGIDSKTRIILYLGRINKTKGIDFLLAAYSKMVKKNHPNDTLLIIAGPDDGYLGHITLLAQALGIASRVLFTGLLTEHEKKCAFVDSTIVVYPSCFEPFGLVTLEAAASSRPVIVSCNTSMATVVREGKFGFSAKYEDKDDLIEKINTLLNDASLRQDMGQRGQRFVFENYNWANIVPQIERAYANVLCTFNRS
jgi:glycosyltransferase involved in cell wall biosynthesis